MNNEKGDTAEESFLMPEPDGVESGQPLEESEQGSEDLYLKNKFEPHKMTQQKQANSPSENLIQFQTQGISVKVKLLGGFSLLTLIIMVLGMYSILALKEIAGISRLISQEQANMAKITEEMKARIYKVRDAEKDFLLLEEAEALERVSRHTSYVRNQLQIAHEVGKKIELSSGIKLGAEFIEISELIDAYEAKFSQQVKEVNQTRAAISAASSDVEDFKRRLFNEIEKNLFLTTDITNNFWIESKKLIKKQITNQVQAVAINNQVFKTLNLEEGNLLSNLQQNLLNVQIQVAKYMDTDRQLYIDAAQAYLLNAKNLISQIQQVTRSEKVLLTMETVATNLNAYNGILKEVIKNVARVIDKKNTSELLIENQKKDLKELGDEIIKLATQLSATSWNNVELMSNKLINSSDEVQLNLLAFAVLGVIVGVFAIIWIPRPILNAINRLLIGTKQVASGNLLNPVMVDGRDELAQLANMFDRMRLNLQTLVERTKKASVEITSMVNEIQASANLQSSTANEQASSLNEFNSTMAQLAASNNEFATVISEVSQYTKQVAEHSKTSSEKSGQLLNSMQLIGDTSIQTANQVKALNDQIDSINNAVAVISGVADQTTLLSMNTSIEANKAGEMGKGFSVVAYEIRRLSERAINSAEDISSKVRKIQSAAENSVMSMDKSSEETRIGIEQVTESATALAAINEAVKQILTQLDTMAATAKDQAQGSQAAGQTVQELNRSSQMMKQSARQTVTVAYEISVMANQLAESVAEFDI